MGETEDLLSIGEVAAATGLRPSALRYYEDEGLIRPAARLGGRRHYHRSTLRRLAVIALCQEVGFSVSEMAQVFGQRRGARNRWRKMAKRKLMDIDGHIERARATRRFLQQALECECDDPANCEMVSAATERRLLSVALGTDTGTRSPRGRARS